MLGKHIPGLGLIATLISDADVLAPDVAYYPRLIAGDQSEAAELIEEHVARHPGETVYDALLLPALTHAERDRPKAD